MNVLVLDPKTVCVEKSETYQAEQLDKLGMEVVPVELRDAYAHVAICVKSKFNASYKEIPDEKFNEVLKYIEFLKQNPN